MQSSMRDDEALVALSLFIMMIPLCGPWKNCVWILNNVLVGNTLNSALCKEMATNRPVFINVISKSKLSQMLTQDVIFFCCYLCYISSLFCFAGGTIS